MIRKIKSKKVGGIIKVDATLERCNNKDIVRMKIRDIDNGYYYYGECEIHILKKKV